MIDFKNQQMGATPSQLSKIEKTDVWYKTPIGLINNLEEALTWLNDNGLDPVMALEPVVVALSVSGYYEVVK